MRIFPRPIALLLLVLLAAFSERAFAEDIRVARNQLIIEWNPSVAMSSHTGDIGAFHIEPGSLDPVSSFSNVSLVEIDQSNHIGPVRSSAEPVVSSNEATVCQNLISSGAARLCSPNYYVQASVIPNDSRRSRDYWHEVIDSYGAWDVTTNSEAVVVGVVDTGINYNHPDLSQNMWRNPGEIPGNNVDDDNNGVIDDVFGLNAVNNTGDPLDDNMHGSHCAGIIGARGNNGQGVAGVAWQAKLMALKFLTADGWGWTMDAIQLFDYAIMMKQRGVPLRVLSNSWGGGGYSEVLAESIRRANREGIIVVAAAGNSGSDNDILPSYPANYDVPNVISVAASDEDNNLTNFSCFGANTVHIAAPGSMIRSTVLGNQYQELSGTSMATPFVSGALALLLANEPGLSISQAIQRLYQSATPLPQLEGVLTSGRLLNLNNLIRGIAVPDPTPGQVCSYHLQEIPYTDTVGRDGAPRVIPGSSGFAENQSLTLPFEFPFYTNSYSYMTVGPNGIVYFGDAAQPWALTFLPYAPTNSIALMHTVFYSWSMPPAPLGVRVRTSSERVDIRWELPHQWNPSAGNIIATLSLFPDGGIEMFIDVPNNRLAATLLYGALVGMRGNNVANSITISRNGIPNLIIGRKGYRLTRPAQCSVEQRVVAPTPTPSPIPTSTFSPPPTFAPTPEGTATPIPTAQPTYPIPTRDGEQPLLLRLEMSGQSLGRLRSGGPLKLSTFSSRPMTVPLRIALDGVSCKQTASMSLVGGPEEFLTRMPNFPYRVRQVRVGYQGTSAVARVTTGRGKARRGHFERACSMMAEVLQR
jgi:subtilisin family serine protease